MIRTGIFGGTFDPVHYGHIRLAETAYNELSLDKVIFMPAYIPPHKADNIVSDWEHRVNMLKLAISDIPYFNISFLEKEQQIFVVGSKPGGEFEKTYDVIKNNFYNNVFYIYNFVAEGEQEDIKELMGEKAGVTFFAEEARDPFVFSGDMKTYGSILSLEEEKDRDSKPVKKKKRLFGKRR